MDASGGTEAAPLLDSTKNEALPPKEIVAAADGPDAVRSKNPLETPATAAAETDQPSDAEANEEGVGHAMVEGAEETAKEIQEKVDAAAEAAKEGDDVVPKVFDEEVAEVIRREEIKEQMDVTPSPARAISPAPPSGQVSVEGSRRSTPTLPSATDQPRTPPTRVETPPRAETSKRDRDEADEVDQADDEPGPSKKQKAATAYDTPLPESLSHLLHPPTNVLYITNLKRPFTVGVLHDYLDLPSDASDESSSVLPPSKGPFASDQYPGLWVSGVKTHAYAVFPSTPLALAAAKGVEGDKWAEGNNAVLHVEFIPADRVRDLVEREEAAWANGRQKLSLRIEKTSSGYDFTHNGGTSLWTNGRAPPGPANGFGRAAPGSGAGAGFNGGFRDRRLSVGRAPPGAPSGPSGMRTGPNGYSPVVLERGGRSTGYGRDGPIRGGFVGASSGPGLRRTSARPSLTYREGPAATARR